MISRHSVDVTHQCHMRHLDSCPTKVEQTRGDSVVDHQNQSTRRLTKPLRRACSEDKKEADNDQQRPTREPCLASPEADRWDALREIRQHAHKRSGDAVRDLPRKHHDRRVHRRQRCNLHIVKKTSSRVSTFALLCSTRFQCNAQSHTAANSTERSIAAATMSIRTYLPQEHQEVREPRGRAHVVQHVAHAVRDVLDGRPLGALSLLCAHRGVGCVAVPPRRVRVVRDRDVVTIRVARARRGHLCCCYCCRLHTRSDARARVSTGEAQSSVRSCWCRRRESGNGRIGISPCLRCLSEVVPCDRSDAHSTNRVVVVWMNVSLDENMRSKLLKIADW